MAMRLNGPLCRLFVACVIATIGLAWYGQQRIVAEDAALGSENTHSREEFLGHSYTASYVKEMMGVLEYEKTRSGVCPASHRKTILWLGNSQLHTVNQFKKGEHLAPYWLRQLSKSPECFVPLGFSLPNINFQEMMVVAIYAIRSLPMQGVVLSLVFDDLREDDLRTDFRPILDDEMRASLGEGRISRDMLRRIDEQKSGTGSAANDNSGLEGFVQKRFEDYLTERFGELFTLWTERPSLRAQVMTDLYFLRNTVLGIKPTSVRRMIPFRYERNMKALEALLVDLREQRIPVILYIAPIRQDVPTPYESAGYSRWKQEIDNLAKGHQAKLLNLENLVPDTEWGSYHKDDVDFMHFRGEGHQRLADAIAPVLRASIGEF
jgi:hypothetical protein